MGEVGFRDRWFAGWAQRSVDSSSADLLWKGICIAIGYLAIHCAFDALFLVTSGFPPGIEPAWRSDLWWTDFINAVLIGYLPAARALAQRGVARDLAELRQRLRCTDAEFAAIRAAAVGPDGPVSRTISLGGLLAGILIVFIDPSVSRGANHSFSDHSFMWALPRTAIFGWLVMRLVVSDFNATRTYAHLGRNAVEIDLLNVNDLGLFARRGQRCALTWVLFSSIFSLFWFGGSAAAGNLPLLVLVLSMATAAFVVPLAAVRKNILAVKRAELDRLREEIRREGERTLVPASARSNPSPQLANLISYYQLIGSAREWPVDAANLLRFLAYLFLGLGSWLGGAVVERALDSALRGVG